MDVSIIYSNHSNNMISLQWTIVLSSIYTIGFIYLIYAIVKEQKYKKKRQEIQKNILELSLKIHQVSTEMKTLSNDIIKENSPFNIDPKKKQRHNYKTKIEEPIVKYRSRPSIFFNTSSRKTGYTNIGLRSYKPYQHITITDIITRNRQRKCLLN